MYKTYLAAWNKDFSLWSKSACMETAEGLSLDWASSRLETKQNAAGAYFCASAESPVVAAAFEAQRFVPSWNCTSSAASWLNVYLRVRRGSDWSQWFTLAVWALSTEIVKRHTVKDQKDAMAAVNTDTLECFTAVDAFQVKLELCALGEEHAIHVRRFAVAYSTKKPNAGDLDSGCCSESSFCHHLSGIPAWSQMLYPDGGKVWCSPTSLSMVMAYWEKDCDNAEARIRKSVASVYDHDFGGYGNWAFNIAYAAEKGYRAVLAFFSSLSQLEPWIAAGIPVVLSVSWNNDNEKQLSNAPCTKSNGHLTVLVGFDADGNALMHEPASPSDETVARTYKRRELELRWLEASGGAVYLVYPGNVSAPSFS